MARDCTRANGHYLNAGSAVVSDNPCTMACWIRPEDTANSQDIMSVGDASAALALRLNAGGSAAGDPIRAIQTNGGDHGIAVSSTGYTANAWYHAAAVFRADDDRSAYIDGGSRGDNNTDPGSMADFDRTRIGELANSSEGNNYDGYVAEAAIWNVALTDGEIKMLAAGVSPLRVRPESLQAYWPLFGIDSPEIDFTGNGNNLTLEGDTGTPAQASHAPVGPMFGFGLFTGLTVTVAAGETVEKTLQDTFTFAEGFSKDGIYTRDNVQEEFTFVDNLDPTTTGSWTLSGVTKDNSGSALGTCEVYLLKDNQDNTLSFVDYTQSDGSGNYEFNGIADNDAQYIVVAWKDDSPHVFDITDHVLQPSQ